MQIEEYGKENDKMIVMLHGAYFVHSFGRQYVLANRYHIIVPHIMGFGAEADRTFDAEACMKELVEFIRTLGEKVTLVGFSLGAQLALKLVSEYEDLFSAVIVVSPWLMKEEAYMEKILEQNLKQLASLKKRWQCHLVGAMNGLPPEQRKEFVEQMQHVKEETVRNVVFNGITLESLSGVANISVPVIALAGAKEEDAVKDSVKELSRMTPSCKYEIWDKAGHNIPPLFSKRFNDLICTMMEETTL